MSRVDSDRGPEFEAAHPLSASPVPQETLHPVREPSSKVPAVSGPGSPTVAGARGFRPGGGNDQPRRNNLAALLTLLHRNGSQTRATLTRATGLNRSTVGALVSDLAVRGLVYETRQIDPGSVGRPSPFVHASESVVAISVNPDIDAIGLGMVGLGGRLLTRVRRPLPAVPTAAAAVGLISEAVAELVRGLPAGQRVAGIGIAVPGLVRTLDGAVKLAPHLRWIDDDFAVPIAEATGLPTHAANDANLALLAESRFGAGLGVTDLLYLNGSSSGIGGGVIAGGCPLLGANGYAGELGHTLVNSVGSRCSCGKRGCLETEVSIHPLIELLGSGPLDADEFETALASSTDLRVRAEIARQLDILGFALGNFITVFNPAVVILGGFLGTLFMADPQRLELAMGRSALGTLAEGVRVTRASLRSQLLMVGAAELAFAALLEDPLGTPLSAGAVGVWVD